MLPQIGCDVKTSRANSEAEKPLIQSEKLTPEEEFKKTLKEAETGFAPAQSLLGLMYFNGEGVTKDNGKAIEWYQKAAIQGEASGQYRLGWMYFQGEGVTKDDSKAVEWYQKAAMQGLAKAQNKLGWMYFEGEGVPKDEAKAAMWLQKAAIQGLANAQNQLGTMYAEGQGVPKDAIKAAEWFQKAAEQGVAEAQYNLGLMYSEGEGVPKDVIKAAELFQKAAAQGIAAAQYNLGVIFVNGRITYKDTVRAYAWFNLAAAQGNVEAQNYRDKLEEKLTVAELTEGQKLASNWKKGDNLAESSRRSSQTVSLNDNPRIPATPSKQSNGTAFIFSHDGHALTNYHVINDCTEVKVAGQDNDAKVITSDSVNDLALLQLPGKSNDVANLNPEPGKLRQGDDVIVFGYPLNFVLSSGGNLTPGILSALTGLGNNTNQIQITAPIQPGSSGSPVMDKKGNVVGVVSMKLNDGKLAQATGQIGQNVNFAVNGQTVKAFLDANHVSYKTGGGFFSREKSNADIAEEARKWTVLVECWK